jgi:hypothetical protein
MNEIEVLKKRLLYTERYYQDQKKLMEDRIALLERREWNERIEKQELERFTVNHNRK